MNQEMEVPAAFDGWRLRMIKGCSCLAPQGVVALLMIHNRRKVVMTAATSAVGEWRHRSIYTRSVN